MFLVPLLLACAGSADVDPHSVGTMEGLYHLDSDFTPDPFTTGPAGAAIALTASGAPVEGALLTVAPWMPDHGHGADEVVATEDGGIYTASWSFPMPGTWELVVTVEGPAGVDEAVVVVDVD